jgi:hypothetical protein
MAFTPSNVSGNTGQSFTYTTTSSPFMGGSQMAIGGLQSPPVCSRWGNWHEFHCVAVSEKFVVVMACACGHVIRDFPEGYDAAKT